MSSESKDDQNSTPPHLENEEASPEEKSQVNEKKIDSEKESEKSESEEDEEMGLLDRPVEITGSRERKKVQRLEVTFAISSKDKHEIPEGSGEKLGECPRIEHQIQKNPYAELKSLHKILFNRPGSGNEIKKNIRRFSGFTFLKGSQEFDKKKTMLEKLTTPVLKHVCGVLDLERNGTKDDVAIRILEFLLKPKASGKIVPPPKKRSNKGDKKTKDKKLKESKKKGSTKKGTSSVESSDSADDENSRATTSDEKDDVRSDEEKPKKKKKITKSKPKENTTKAKKNSEKNEEIKSTSKAVKRKNESESDDESSDDEPLVKKSKRPSDDDIKKLVKEILDSADLQEITMKKVIKQVADTYPDFDLSDKKEFIKTTVKSVIS